MQAIKQQASKVLRVFLAVVLTVSLAPSVAWGDESAQAVQDVQTAQSTSVQVGDDAQEGAAPISGGG